MENYKAFCDKVVNDSELINTYKELYNGVYMKVRSLIPNYLEKQTSFIIHAVTLDRSLIISRAFDEGIIKADETYGSDIYNGSYLLSRKRELYIREDESFIMSVTMMLEKVPGNTGSMPTAAAKTTTGLN